MSIWMASDELFLLEYRIWNSVWPPFKCELRAFFTGMNLLDVCEIQRGADRPEKNHECLCLWMAKLVRILRKHISQYYSDVNWSCLPRGGDTCLRGLMTTSMLAMPAACTNGTLVCVARTPTVPYWDLVLGILSYPILSSKSGSRSIPENQHFELAPELWLQ